MLKTILITLAIIYLVIGVIYTILNTVLTYICYRIGSDANELLHSLVEDESVDDAIETVHWFYSDWATSVRKCVLLYIVIIFIWPYIFYYAIRHGHKD